MTKEEERLRILKLIQSGQVTAEEGAQMLAALSDEPTAPEPSTRTRQPRQLRIRVTDLNTGRQTVNINLPWNLVNVGMKMGARFARDEVKLEDFTEAIQAGAEGKIMDVIDESSNERVEIFVE
jgi:hypothetical protein